MEKEIRPVLIYDNLCISCTKYAKWINYLVKGKITMIGHHTPKGKELKKHIFSEGYDGLEMSWFVTNDYAYGGRTGLFKLIKYILLSKKEDIRIPNRFDLEQCITDCKTVKGTIMRSCSMMSHGRKIAIPS